MRGEAWERFGFWVWCWLIFESGKSTEDFLIGALDKSYWLRRPGFVRKTKVEAFWEELKGWAVLPACAANKCVSLQLFSCREANSFAFKSCYVVNVNLDRTISYEVEEIGVIV